MKKAQERGICSLLKATEKAEMAVKRIKWGKIRWDEEDMDSVWLTQVPQT